MVREESTGHQLAGGHSSWCPELESQTAHRRRAQCERLENVRAPPDTAVHEDREVFELGCCIGSQLVKWTDFWSLELDLGVRVGS